MNRKGQGLSVNIIILIALGLIILVIAVLLVNRSGKNISDNTTKSCISLAGTCQENWCSGNYISIPDGDESCAQSTGTIRKPFCCRYDFGGDATQ